MCQELENRLWFHYIQECGVLPSFIFQLFIFSFLLLLNVPIPYLFIPLWIISAVFVVNTVILTVYRTQNYENSGGIMWWWLEMFLRGRWVDRICCGLLPIFYFVSIFLFEVRLMRWISWLWSPIFLPIVVFSLLFFIPLMHHSSNQGIHESLRSFLKLFFVSFLIVLITVPLVSDMIIEGHVIWLAVSLFVMELLGIILVIFLAIVYKYGVNFSVHQRRGLYRNQIGPEWGMSTNTRIWGWGWTYGIEWSWNIGTQENTQQQRELNGNSSIESVSDSPLAYSLLFFGLSMTFGLVFQLILLFQSNSSLHWYSSPFFYLLLSMGTLFISSLFWGRSAYVIRMKTFNQQLQNMSCPSEKRNVIPEPKLAWT